MGEEFSPIKKQTAISFGGDVSLKNLFFLIEEYSKTPPLNAAPNSYLQAVLQKIKLEIALYKNNSNEVQNVLGQIEKRNWDLVHFTACNIDFNKWLQGLKQKIGHRDEFIKQISSNKHDRKLEKLKTSEITL